MCALRCEHVLGEDHETTKCKHRYYDPVPCLFFSPDIDEMLRREWKRIVSPARWLLVKYLLNVEELSQEVGMILALLSLSASEYQRKSNGLVLADK